ncbi:MAG: ABC transporter ATP-binding protein [Peptostreptococcaceae bacterium]|nr:ABC transporter ATP-binding protein [Peptostreptococcaceae bacterium]
MQKVIEMINISKSFGSIKANENVNLTINKGEIHALLGENGAGKSTLMNMLSGIYSPDSGFILVDGKKQEFHSPGEPIKLGIGMIHQHFKLIDVLSAKENIILGQKGSAIIRGKSLSKEIRAISDKYRLDIDPNKKVYNMSVGEKQTLEIIKVLYRGAKVLIMDEPTAVLTPQEIKRLFRIMRNMKEQGNSIIIITHKMNEVMEISDRVTVLRKGRTVDTLETSKTTAKELVEMMVGKSVELSIEKPKSERSVKPMLELDEVTVLDSDKRYALKEVSLNVYGGEILGVAGLAGSGQKELCETIAGLLKTNSGRIYFEGENIVDKTPREIINLGVRMGFIPEDRLGMGLVGSMDIVDNIMLKDYQKKKGLFINKKEMVPKAKEIVERLEIVTPGIDKPVRKMSGGNIQKVLLGREIDASPKLLITAYPVRGLDIGASYKIYDLLNEQKQNGVGVLFIGEDLDILLEICDRIAVIYDGMVTGVVETDDTSKEEVGILMAGGTMEDVEKFRLEHPKKTSATKDYIKEETPTKNSTQDNIEVETQKSKGKKEVPKKELSEQKKGEHND